VNRIAYKFKSEINERLISPDAMTGSSGIFERENGEIGIMS
jgi:hypothetical protein